VNLSLWPKLNALWRNLIRRQRVEADLDAEILSPRELLEDEKLRAGADPIKVRREASIELGGAERLKEELATLAATNAVFSAQDFDGRVERVQLFLELGIKSWVLCSLCDQWN
jgi:hypothetical protein